MLDRPREAKGNSGLAWIGPGLRGKREDLDVERTQAAPHVEVSAYGLSGDILIMQIRHRFFPFFDSN